MEKWRAGEIGVGEGRWESGKGLVGEVGGCGWWERCVVKYANHDEGWGVNESCVVMMLMMEKEVLPRFGMRGGRDKVGLLICLCWWVGHDGLLVWYGMFLIKCANGMVPEVKWGGGSCWDGGKRGRVCVE